MTRFGKFELIFNQNGDISYKLDKDDPDDVEKLGRFIRDNPQIAPRKLVDVSPPPMPHVEEPFKGDAFHIIINKYEERFKTKWAEKTLYGYLQNINIFKDWATDHFKDSDFRATQVNRKVVAMYIDFLRKKDINDNTIAKNYLICLNGLFDFAKSIGEYPDIDAPTRKHNLIDKTTKNEKPRNPFEIEELKVIFDPKNLPTDKHPDQFWMPLIGLFTGGRISEICQLHRIDIRERDGFYTLSITDDGDGDKRIKSMASKRIIPIHPTLIEIGFIDFYNDMEKFGGQLFPTVKPDPYGYYGKEPGRRFATYLDKINITDPTKVFHSFRSTANVVLMDNGIEEEKRCAFIGHEHHTVNSGIYKHKGNASRGKFTPEFLNEIITPALKYNINFTGLKYKKGMFDKFIYKTLRKWKAEEGKEKLKKKEGIL